MVTENFKQKQRRSLLIENNICLDCLRENDCYFTRCTSCRKKISEYKISLYNYRILSGLCRTCGKEKNCKQTSCEMCRKKRNEHLSIPEIREKTSAQQKVINNKPEIKAKQLIYIKKKRKEDTQFYLRDLLRSRIYQAVKKNYKSGSAVKDLGCTVEEFKLYIESKFLPGMSWKNIGRGTSGWHLDHIIPLSMFDLSEREQFIKACHYTNMQPLWGIDNIKKGNRN